VCLHRQLVIWSGTSPLLLFFLLVLFACLLALE
jgi:hypothetical protein